MGSTERTREELQNDLGTLRHRLEDVERAEAERARALNALRESEDRYRTLFEQAALGVAQIETKTGRFLKINEKYCDIVGYGEAELLAMDFQSITHRDDLEKDLDPLRQLVAGEISAYQTEKRYVHKQVNNQDVRVRFTSLEAAARRLLDQLLAEDHARLQ
jgi:PAS domain S-box-containing protein